MLSAERKTPAYVVAATYYCVPGEGEHVADLLRRMADQSRAEPGCLFYEAHRAVDDPDVLYLYEQYTDEAAYEAHRASPHFNEIIETQAIPRLSERTRSFYRTLE